MTYAGAPYNFISFPEKVIIPYESEERLPRHDRFEENTLTGYISYTLKAETPVMVAKVDGDKKIKEFMQNANNQYIIPGNTVRGLLRTAVQVFGQSDFSRDIKNERFLFRMLTTDNDKLNKQYKTRIGIDTERQQKIASMASDTVLEKLKAGYIRKINKDEYEIIPAKKDKSGRQYYSIREYDLRRMTNDSKVKDKINWMYTEKIIDCLHLRGEGMDDPDHPWYEEIKKHKEKSYKPYTISNITYSFDSQNDRVVKISESNSTINELDSNATLLCTGYVEKKLLHYLIREIDNDAIPIKIDKQYIEEYNKDLVFKKNNLPFYKLPENKEPKAIFYVENDNRIDFGFTPYLRVFYKHNVLDGIPNNAKIDFQDGIDYAQSMFGYSVKDKKQKNRSYRSRISVSDVILQNGMLLTEQSMMLAEPKASCYPLYLKQEEGKEFISYNDSELQLRGIKQYWLMQNHEPKASLERDGRLRKSNTTFVPIDREAEFTGVIHFTNLYKEEVGLLLLALKQEEKCYHHIGMGKPYGYGRVTVQNIDVKIKTLNNWYSTFKIEEGAFTNINVSECISFYKTTVKNRFNIDIDKAVNVQEWIEMKSSLKSQNETRYMEIQHKVGYKKINEYSELLKSKRSTSFPTVLEMSKAENKNLSNKNKHQIRTNKEIKPSKHRDKGHSSGFNMPFGNLKELLENKKE